MSTNFIRIDCKTNKFAATSYFVPHKGYFNCYTTTKPHDKNSYF